MKRREADIELSFGQNKKNRSLSFEWGWIPDRWESLEPPFFKVNLCEVCRMNKQWMLFEKPNHCP